MIVLGLIYYFLLAAVITVVATLIGDILMMRWVTGISWKESVRCGWLYFIDRFKK
jgi:hypothetical protein